MAPGDVVVEADQHQRHAQESDAADVHLVVDRDLGLVEPVRPLPVPVGVAEHHAAGLARGRRRKAIHVAADARVTAHLQGGRCGQALVQGRRGLRILRRAGLGCGRGDCIGDGLHEIAVPPRQVGRVHAAPDVLLRDGLHPCLAAAGGVGRPFLGNVHVLVVAGHEALDHLPQILGLRRGHLLHHVGGDHMAVEEVRVDVARASDGAVVDQLCAAAKVARALAPVGEEGIRQRAQVVLRLDIPHTEAPAGPVGGLDVRHAHRGAADLRLVRQRRVVRIVVAPAAGQQGQDRRRQQRAWRRSTSDSLLHALSPLLWCTPAGPPARANAG